MVIYLFLVLWSLSLLAIAFGLVRSSVPQASTDVNDFYFSLLRGIAAVANLIWSYRWAGARNRISQWW